MNNIEGEDIHKFKEWPEQEIFGDLMLQYEFKNKGSIVNIPFRIVGWCSAPSYAESWEENETEIIIFMSGTIIFEGIRHCNFAEDNDGYINYPDVKQLGLCLLRLDELCVKYCSSYD